MAKILVGRVLSNATDSVSVPGVATAARQDTQTAALVAVMGAQTDGTQKTQVTALPAGLATGAKQDTGNASCASIDTKITACNTGAVVIAASALPSGASTAARQDTGNVSLASVDGKLPSTVASEATLALIKAKTDNLDVALSTRAVTGLTDTQLRAAAVGVADDYANAPEVLADQAGAGAVLTFTFANPVVLVLVESTSGTPASPGGIVSRISFAAQTPSATLGVRCVDEKTYMPCPPSTVVKVWALAGATVNMIGWRR